MRIKPIIFNAEMINAIIENHKTETRRAARPQPTLEKGMWNMSVHQSRWCAQWPENKSRFRPDLAVLYKSMPYLKDDILYIRETFAKRDNKYVYRAENLSSQCIQRWRPAIHMPKDAARIFLEVTDVYLERLQEIDDDGVVAEGKNIGDPFDELWNKTISAKKRDQLGWDANPWVWVIKFEKCDKPDEWDTYCERSLLSSII